MRLGLVGNGIGGRYFPAPIIAAAGDVELAGVLDAARTSAAENRVVDLS